MSSPSLLTNKHPDPMLTYAGLSWVRGMYVAPERVFEPSAPPLFGAFSGFPPLLFQAGSIEMPRDESIRAAEHLHRAGKAVELEIWEGMAHGFQALRTLPQARAANENIVRFIAKHTGWTV
jgi:epsilon-lactone hydrolase